jgi:hypothetical protein
MEFKFNLKAMASPSTKQEFIALLDEALRLVDELTAMTQEDTQRMQKQSCLCDAVA